MQVEFDIRSAMGLFLRQYRLIASIVFLFAVIAGTLTFLVTPKFASTALVLIDSTSRNLIDPNAKVVDSGAENVRVMTEMEVLASDATMMGVISSKNLVTDDEFGPSSGLLSKLTKWVGLQTDVSPNQDKSVLETLKRFRKAVDVERRGTTNLIAVTVSSRNANRAAELSNALVQTYIEQQISSKVQSARAALDIIDKQAAEVNSAIVATERRFDTFINDNLERLDKQTGNENLNLLRQQLEQLKQAGLENSHKSQIAQTGLQSGNLEQVVTALADTQLNDLDAKRKALGEKIANKTLNTQEAFDLKASLTAIENDIRTEASRQIEQLQKSVSETETRSSQVRSELRNTIIRSDLPPEILTEIYSIQQTADATRRQYQELIGRKQVLQSQVDLQVADSRLVSSALAATEPYFPIRLLIIGLAAALGFIFGIGAAVLRDQFIGGFLDENQLRDGLQVELVTTIARQEGANLAEGPNSRLSDMVITSKFSSFAEGIRKIRALISQQRRLLPVTTDETLGLVIAVSSANPAEGKTTLAISLARTLAQAGRRTLLIDCDLRRPAVAKTLGLEPNVGLEEFLGGNADPTTWESISNQDPLSPLVAVLAGQSFNSSAEELFLDWRFAKLLATGRRNFEYVILDTPPVEPVVDSLYIVPHADILLFVTRWAMTSQAIARKSVNWLRGAAPDMPVIAILNDKESNASERGANSNEYYR